MDEVPKDSDRPSSKSKRVYRVSFGQDWKEAWGRPPFIVLVGTWVLLCPLVIAAMAGAVAIAGITAIAGWRLLTFAPDRFTFGELLICGIGAAICVGVVWVFGTMLWRTTMAFIRLRNSEADDTLDSGE